jgi:TPR repeat protein
MYADGTGVPKDSAQAVAWYRKASAQGDAVGQFLLGNAYMTGVGVRKDLDQAIYLFQKSAKQGNEDAKVLAEAVATLKLGQAELVRRGVDPRTFQ